MPGQIVKIISGCLESESLLRKEESLRYDHSGGMLQHMKDVLEETENKIRLDTF
jgi:hypothetical protein